MFNKSEIESALEIIDSSIDFHSEIGDSEQVKDLLTLKNHYQIMLWTGNLTHA